MASVKSCVGIGIDNSKLIKLNIHTHKHKAGLALFNTEDILSTIILRISKITWLFLC